MNDVQLVTTVIGRRFPHSLDSISVSQNSTAEKRLPATEHGPEPAEDRAESLASRLKLLGWSGIVFAILQSACTAVIAISGLRVAIGFSALAAAAGVHAPAKGFHQDAIRIPMMLFALVGSLLNLFVVWKIRDLRGKPASQWRQKPLSKKKLDSERLQITLSILTLVLLAAEWMTHPMIHRVP